MQVTDLEKIEEELIEKFDSFWNFAILKEELANTNSSYILAKQFNEIIGFAGLKVIDEEADIMNIVIRKDKRNQGIGKKILNELIKLARNIGVKRILLEVNENNTVAKHIYSECEFKIIGQRKNYYKTEDALIMELNILNKNI